MAPPEALPHDGYQMKNAAEKERAHRHSKEARAPLNDGEDGVQQAERIEARRHPQPDNAHFRHARVCGDSKGLIFKYIAGCAQSVHPRTAALLAHVDLEFLPGALHFPFLVTAHQVARIEPQEPAAQVDVAEQHAA